MPARFCRQFAVLCAVALVSAQTMGCAWGGDNLLKNPGFEELAADGVPEHWQRQHNETLSGPFAVVKDAHGGERAVCLMTEEWNYQRPQFITQVVKLPANANTLRLSAHCKGQGQVNMVFRFLKGGNPHEIKKISRSFGSVDSPVEQLNEFALGQTYDLYEAWAQVPDGADGVMVKLGNTVGPLDRLNIWGKAWIDDASLVASDKDAPAVRPTHALSEQPPAPRGGRDVARQCRVVFQPPSFEPQLLVDGDVNTTPALMGGVGRGGKIRFLLPKPIRVRSVCMHLLGNAESLVVRGDAEGDGVYETMLGRAVGLSGKGWLAMDLKRERVRGLEIRPVTGKISSFRKAPAFVSEVKVFVADGDCAKAGFDGWGSFLPTTQPQKDPPELSMQPVEVKVPALEKSRFRRTVCADLWVWGVDARKKDSKLPDFANNKAFRRNVDTAKSMGVDSILIDLTNSSVWNLMPWPSKVCNGTNENILKATIDALHAEGLEVFVEIIHNITPFETIKWHYPEEETSRYPEMKQYPSIIHGDHVRKNWLTIMEEIMGCGADGVGISSDEQYYKGHFMETFPGDDSGRKLYRERFGHELPAHEEDTLAFRQWIQMRHEGICDLFGYWTAQLKKKYPNVYTSTMLMHWAHAYSYLTETGVPVDMLGARAGITEIGSDYMGPYGIRMAAAANGWRKATMLHNGDMWPHPPLPDVHFYGTTLWNVMYGAGSINYWRYNYVVDNGHAPALTKAYAMVHDLDALGAYDARPPKRIALLSSRAGIDWWQIKAWWGKHDDPHWDRGMEGQRGWFADESVFNILQQNGYPFDWFFLDYPEQLKDLEQYKILIVPFAYSVSEQAAKRIKAAAANGATVLLFDGKAGPTDQWGEPHAGPILSDLVDSGRAIVFDEDILAWGGCGRFRQKVMGAIDKALGDAHPLKLRRYGKKIDATLLEKAQDECFVFLLNWERAPARVDLSLSLPKGTYEVLVRDENGWHRGSIGGRGELTDGDLRAFRMQLGPGKPYVAHLQRKHE